MRERRRRDEQTDRREDPVIAARPGLSNHALARVVETSGGAVTGHRFEVGTHLSPELAAAAKRAVRDGAVSTRELIGIRAAALGGDSTVDDHERLFMAGLLDAANARALDAQTFGPGDSITFAPATVTPAHRAAATAAGRAELPADVVRLLGRAADAMGDFDVFGALRRLSEADRAAVKAIARLTGRSFAPIAGDAVALAGRSGMGAALLLTGMLAAASDSTPGDLAMAAVVIAIAQAEGHPLINDLIAGRVHVDEVPEAAMPGGAGHFADYVTIGQDSGAKGDTIYLPTGFDLLNAHHRSVVVHELRHAVDDKANAGGNVQFIDRAQAELRAYRAQGRSLMSRLRGEAAAQRALSAGEIGAEWNAIVLLGMALESRSDAAVNDPLIAEVNAAAPAGNQLSRRDLTAVLARSVADLERLALAEISRVYGIASGGVVAADGFAGESVLDWITRIGP